MNEEWKTLKTWASEGHTCAQATVVQTWGSGPRPVGSIMGIRQDYKICGSVSGGCVETAVIDEAMQVLLTGQPVLVEFSVSDDTAWSVGLSCGGALKVFIEPFIGNRAEVEEQEIYRNFLDLQSEKRTIALVTNLQTANHALVVPDEMFLSFVVEGKFNLAVETVKQQFSQLFRRGQSAICEVEDEQIFLTIISPPPIALIIGAAHITVELIKIAGLLGFTTIVVDPRAIFSERERFGNNPPDKLITMYPDECLPEILCQPNIYAMTLSHDPKIDDPALHLLLRSNVEYIGALGSKKTHEKRLNRLREAGFMDDEINRISAPIGLDIHAVSPAEIALSIMAEITAIRRSKSQ